MNLPSIGGRPSAWTLKRYVPLTAIGVALICWLFAAGGIRIYDVISADPPSLWNPFAYVLPMFFHFNWEHFIGNIRLWIPFAIVFTLLTSDRHLLGLAVTVNVLTVITGLAVGEYGVGLSSVVFGVIAATLVRSVGIAMQDASMETLQTMLVVVFTPAMVGFFLLAIVNPGAAGLSNVAHFSHLFGFLFGGAIEAIYVLEGHEEDGEREREIPKYVGT